MVRRISESESGTTLVELIVAVTLFSVVIGAAYFIMDSGNVMYLFAKDGFEAQDQGRLVLAKITKYARQAESLNVPGYPIVKADPRGTYFDARLDANADGQPDIIRFELRPSNYEIVMNIDYRQGGLYNYQAVGETKEAYDTTYPAGGGNWDETIVVASKVVSKPPPGGWSAQNVATDPQTDKRVFTFYGNDISTPLDSSSPVWMNSIRAVKIITLTDIRPAQIPSPFQVETNLNFRNLVRE